MIRVITCKRETQMADLSSRASQSSIAWEEMACYRIKMRSEMEKRRI